MVYQNIFGKRIYQMRKKYGWKQAELGEKVGLTHKAISTIESGKRGTSVEKLMEFAYLFRVSVDYLLGITDDPTWRGTQDEE